MRHLLRDDDLSPAEQAEVLALAHEVKRDPYARRPLAGPRTVAVMFDRNSTRTRVSFAAGIAALGGHPLLMDAGTTQAGRGEPVADLARVLGRMTAAAVWRTARQSDLAELAARAEIPVVNALTDDFHPCQLLADLMTIQEHRGELAGLSMVFLGDGACNVARSTLLAGALAGMHVRIAAPAGHQPAPEIVADAERWAERTGGSVVVGDDPEAAVSGADVLMTDTWVSMGRETEREARIAAFGRFGVTADLVARAADEVVVLHCLPAYRGLEITAEVLDGPRSVVWDQAENRLHAQQALLIWLLERAGEEER